MKIKKKNKKGKIKRKKIALKQRRKVLVFPPKFSRRKIKRIKKKQHKKFLVKKRIKKHQSLKKSRQQRRRRSSTKSGKKIKKKVFKKLRGKKHILKKKKASKIKKIKVSEPKTSFPAGLFFKARIKVIGIGGGGSSIVSEISRSLNKATFVIADTDTRVFNKQKGVKYFLFGQEQTHGLGTGLNPELAREAAEQEKEKISNLFQDQDIVIFIASLGGGVGSGATKVFAEVSKNFGGITFGIFTLPFKFEGKNKYKIAYKALRELKKSLNVSITIPNERIFKIINSDTAIISAFSTVNKKLIESLESLIDLIYSPGVINIDFADIRTILKGRGNSAFLNTAEASGKDRSEKIVKEILHNPLYQNNNFTPEKILFNISGGNSLSMFEVDKISKAISQTNPKAKIIFGISKNSKYKNKIKATLLMTGDGVVADDTMEKEKVELKIKETKKAKKIVKQIKVKKYKKKTTPVKHSEDSGRMPFEDALMPVFNNVPVDLSMRKLSVMEVEQSQLQSNRGSLIESGKPKKTIRRTALEIKKAQEMEENRKSMQEKEWEIPAFLRKIKFK